MKKFFIMVVCLLGIVLAVEAETIQGSIECIDSELQVSVILPNRQELGPFAIEDGVFQIDLPLGVRSGVLIFHGYETSIQEHFQDTQRPFHAYDYYQASYSFRIPQGQLQLNLEPLRLQSLRFIVKRSESAAAQTPGLVPGVPMQFALLKDGFKTSISRVLPLESEFTIVYLVWPEASYSLAMLNPNAPFANREIIRSQSIRMSEDCSLKEVRWEY